MTAEKKAVKNLLYKAIKFCVKCNYCETERVFCCCFSCLLLEKITQKIIIVVILLSPNPYCSNFLLLGHFVFSRFIILLIIHLFTYSLLRLKHLTGEG